MGYAQGLGEIGPEREATIYFFSACPSGWVADSHWRPGRKGSNMEHKANPQPGVRAVGQTSKVVVHADDAHRSCAYCAMGAFGKMACEWQRRRDRDGLGS